VRLQPLPCVALLQQFRQRYVVPLLILRLLPCRKLPIVSTRLATGLRRLLLLQIGSRRDWRW
jgi:hypothetical protein